MESCYYVPVDPPAASLGDGYEYFQPTEATLSVWAPTMQHGGPPAGLTVRALERCSPDPAQHLTRVTTEILGPVGLGINRVRAQVIRPGRQISLVSSDLEVCQPDGSFRVAARTTGWRIRTTDSSAVERTPAPLTPGPGELSPTLGISVDPEVGIPWGALGFIGTCETAIVPGRLGETMALWLRPALPLVGGEEITDLESIFTVLDIANGVGTTLNPAEWTWMNTDTTVHLTRIPRGPWLGVDSDMLRGADGFGATFADLYDATGFIGRSAQTVLLAAN